MKIYLASRYSRHKELQKYAKELEQLGHIVTARWIYNETSEDERLLNRVRIATEDYSDLLVSDVCISFTEAPKSEHSRGGRHVEFGMALAMEKVLVVIGHRENVFHNLPEVNFFEQWQDCLTYITKNLPHLAAKLEAQNATSN